MSNRPTKAERMRAAVEVLDEVLDARIAAERECEELRARVDRLVEERDGLAKTAEAARRELVAEHESELGRRADAAAEQHARFRKLEELAHKRLEDSRHFVRERDDARAKEAEARIELKQEKEKAERIQLAMANELEAEIERLRVRNSELVLRVGRAESRPIALAVDLRKVVDAGSELRVRLASRGTIGEIYRCELVAADGSRRAIDHAPDDLRLRTRMGIDFDALGLEGALRRLLDDEVRRGRL